MSWPATIPSPLKIYRGDTYIAVFKFQHPDQSPLDISTFGTWTAQLRRQTWSTHFTPFEIDFTDSADGEVRLMLSDDQTSQLGSSGVWDMQYESNGQTYTMLKGTYILTNDVTRDS